MTQRQMNRDMRLLEVFREISNSLTVKVKVQRNEIIRLVAADLMAKYEAALPGTEAKEALKKVLLSYFLTEDEFEEMIGGE